MSVLLKMLETNFPTQTGGGCVRKKGEGFEVLGWYVDDQSGWEKGVNKTRSRSHRLLFHSPPPASRSLARRLYSIIHHSLSYHILQSEKNSSVWTLSEIECGLGRSDQGFSYYILIAVSVVSVSELARSGRFQKFIGAARCKTATIFYSQIKRTKFRIVALDQNTRRCLRSAPRAIRISNCKRQMHELTFLFILKPCMQ